MSSVTLTLRKKWGPTEIPYKLKYDAQDPKNAPQAKVNDTAVKVIWKDVEVEPTKLAELLMNSYDKEFTVDIRPSGTAPTEIVIARRILSAIPSNPATILEEDQPEEPPPRDLTFLTMQTPFELMGLTKKTGPFFALIVDKMASKFTESASIPSINNCEAIESVIEYANSTAKKEVIMKLLGHLNDLSALHATKSLTAIFDNLLIASYRLDTQNALQDFDKENLIFLLDHLIGKIEASTDDTAQVFYWAGVKSLLEIMWNRGLQGIDRQKYYMRFCKVAHEHERNHLTGPNKPPLTRFLAEQSLQYLVAIGDTETQLASGLRHLVAGVKVLGQIADKVSISEPWHILGLINDQFFNDVKELFSKDTSAKKWFFRLKLLKQAYLNPSDPVTKNHIKEDFLKFARACLQDLTEVKDKLGGDSDKYSVIYGLIYLLQNMAKLYAEVDIEIASHALDVLAKIKRDNQPQANNHLYLRVGKKHRKVLLTEIESIFCSLANHPVKAVSEKALENLAQPLPPHAEVLSPTLFQASLNKAAPWIEAMNILYNEINEPKFREQNRYFISPRVICRGVVGNLNDILNTKIKDSANKSILLSGPAGSGKTFVFKNRVLDILNHFDESSPLVFYVNLPNLINPKTGLIEETLKKLKLLAHAEQVKGMQSIWYCDGFDELVSGQTDPFPIYESNHLSTWPNARFVFACRGQDLRIYKPNYFTSFSNPEAFQELQLMQFDEAEIKRFLKEFIKAARTSSDNSLASIVAEEYYQYLIKQKLGERISNPFNLKIFAQALEKCKKPLVSDPITWNDLFDEWFFHRMREEYIRLHESGRGAADAVSYLEFALEIRRCLDICRTTVINREMKEELTRMAQEYIVKQQREKAELIALNSDPRQPALKLCEINIKRAQEAPSKLLRLFNASPVEKSQARGTSLVSFQEGVIEYENSEILGYLHGLGLKGIAYEKLKKRLATIHD